MEALNNCINLLNKYGIILETNTEKKFLVNIGIGDLLFVKLLQEHGIIGKVYINIKVVQEYFNNLYNALEFRIKLLKDLECDVGYIYDIDIVTNKISYLHYVKMYLNSFMMIKKINTDYNIEEKYICLHTKLRFDRNLSYEIPKIKKMIKNFFTNYRTHLTIVILGERNFPKTWEAEIHKISTIYEELCYLKDNNRVIDLTEDNVYDNLNYDLFKRDVGIIRNAEANISVGCGGSFCMEIIFGKRNIVFIDKLDLSFYFKYNNFDQTTLHTNIESFFEDISRL